MIKDLNELTQILDTKVKPIVDAIKDEDPTTERYSQLLNNFNATMQVSSSVNRTLMDVALRAQELKEQEEAKKNESNN